MRLAIRQVRIDADKLRGKLKEDGIRYGKAVQGVYNVIEYLLKPTEEYLYEQERYVEIQKEKKIKENQEARYADIQPYLNYLPISFHNRLGELSVIEWSQVFEQAKGVHDAEVEAKELADKMEREAEEKRLREAEEKRIKDEKEKKELQAKIKAQELENRKAEARAVAERAMREAEEKKATAELKAKEQELEKATAERKAKEQELAKATALAETEKRKRMEAEKMLKETSQRVSSPTIQRQVSAVETGLFPPETKRLDNEIDAEVLQLYVNQFTSLMLNMPKMKSLAGKKLATNINDLVTKLTKFAQDGINKLK